MDEDKTQKAFEHVINKIKTLKRISTLSKLINDDNEDLFIAALRKYYQDNFSNGISDESFVLWIEDKIR